MRSRALLVCLLALLLLPSAARADYRSAVMADSPSAYWRLGEASGTAAADQSANANGGTYAGGVALNQPGAIAGEPNTARSATTTPTASCASSCGPTGTTGSSCPRQAARSRTRGPRAATDARAGAAAARSGSG